VEQIDLLQKALDDEGIPYTADTLSHFGVYFTLLLDWNRRINLISKNDEDRIITRHFLQSIGLVRVVDFPDSAAVLDLGSGGGFPGIPLKLIRPDLHVFLVESKQKKGRFLQTVVDGLSLPQLEVIHGRAEERSGEIAGVDFIVCRAVTDLVTLIRWSPGNLRKEGGRLIVIKGEGVHGELKELKRSAPDLGVAEWNVLPYNPFPTIFTLENSYVVDVEIRLI
jgi:16S rRNA (guanine527-N7)-methyltransferase